MPWQTPKTNWTAPEGVTDSDFNRIEENTRVAMETIPFNTTTGTGFNYAITLDNMQTPYVPGAKFSARMHVACTNQATISVNGGNNATIYKSNGSQVTAGYLKQGGVYSFMYVASPPGFFLQGEGGEYGEATPETVLEGVGFGTEDGLGIGTYKPGYDKTGDMTQIVANENINVGDFIEVRNGVRAHRANRFTIPTNAISQAPTNITTSLSTSFEVMINSTMSGLFTVAQVNQSEIAIYLRLSFPSLSSASGSVSGTTTRVSDNYSLSHDHIRSISACMISADRMLLAWTVSRISPQTNVNTTYAFARQIVITNNDVSQLGEIFSLQGTNTVATVSNRAISVCSVGTNKVLAAWLSNYASAAGLPNYAVGAYRSISCRYLTLPNINNNTLSVEVTTHIPTASSVVARYFPGNRAIIFTRTGDTRVVRMLVTDTTNSFPEVINNATYPFTNGDTTLENDWDAVVLETTTFAILYRSNDDGRIARFSLNIPNNNLITNTDEVVRSLYGFRGVRATFIPEGYLLVTFKPPSQSVQYFGMVSTISLGIVEQAVFGDLGATEQANIIRFEGTPNIFITWKNGNNIRRLTRMMSLAISGIARTGGLGNSFINAYIIK